MMKLFKNLLKFNIGKKQESVYDKINDLFDSLETDEICITIGEDLLPFADKISGKIWDLRNKLKDKTGLIIPAVRILDDFNLQENEFEIKLMGEKVFNGYTVPTEDYATNEITRSLEKVCMENIEKVLTNETVEKYIDTVQRNNGWLIWYLARIIPTTGIKVILAELIRSGKPINNITYIFEKICEQATKSGDIYSIPDAHKIAEKLKLELK